MAGRGQETSRSPRSRLKFLCSFGGMILPRPSDGHLKYVGGESRVVAVPRTVTFAELRKKLASMFNAEAVIKYQMASEDLDALVSITCDEDLHHMLAEYDRLEAQLTSEAPTPECSCSHPRLRVFLFPSTPVTSIDGPTNIHLLHHHQHHHHLTAALEQRYIDAVNGVSRTPTGTPPTSPRELVGHDGVGMFSYQNGGGGRTLHEINRVHSSPNLCSTGHQHTHRQQQHAGSRMSGNHTGGPGLVGTVEHQVGSAAAAGNTLRRQRPSPLHPGRRYYSPVQVGMPGNESRGCPYCGHVDEFFSP